MKGPRWFNPTLYAALGFGLVGLLYTAYRRDYDVTETVGFVAVNIFFIFLVFGLVLTALAALVNLIRGKSHLPKLSLKEKHILRAYLMFMCGCFAASAFALWHPLGWFWSVAIAVSVYLIGVFLSVKLSKGLSEEEMTAFQDRVLAAKEESNPLYLIP